MKYMTSALVAAAALLASCNFAAAQRPGSIHINVNAELRVDCSRPLHVNNFKVRIDARNTIAPDKTAFANWQITSLGTETLSFATKLGSGAIDRTAQRQFGAIEGHARQWSAAYNDQPAEHAERQGHGIRQRLQRDAGNGAARRVSGIFAVERLKLLLLQPAARR